MRTETLHVVSDYIDEAFNFIALREGFADGLPYFDSANPRRATIGYGFNIEVSDTDYLLLVLNELGIIDDTMTEAEIISRRDEFATAINNTPHTGDRAIITQQLIANLNQVAAQYGVTTFSIDQTQGRSIFEDIILGLEIGPITVQGKQQKLDALLQNTLAHNSKEYVAVMSLYYTGESLVDSRKRLLANAIIKDNRAEAWYEIRYNSNSDGQHASRRYSEANLFGLYDYGSYAGSLTPEEAKEVMRMYTIHKTDINDYERTYTPPLSQNILSIDNEILLAKNYLIDNFSQGRTIDGEIIVGKGITTYEYKDQGNYTDNLTGTNNNDLIFGEKGDDTIRGGTGNDILIGGEGVDTYYYRVGDGSDWINDTGNNNVIIEKADGTKQKITNFYETGDNIWTTPDGKIEITHHSPWQIVLEDGSTLTLGENFQDGDFGIHLKDVPENPTTTHEIIEDDWGSTIPSGGIIDTAANDHLLVV